jgi:hypothetical protein
MKPSGDASTKLIRTALGSMHRTSFENVGVAQITGKAGVPKGSAGAQIAAVECSFHSTGLRGLPRRTSHDPGCGFHRRL